MTLRFIKSSEKKEILAELNEKFGITEIPYLLIEWGKERIKAFSGSLSKEEIMEIGQLARIEGIGISFAKKELGGLRPSMEGLQLLSKQITKNIIDVDEAQYNLWMRGHSLEIAKPSGLYAIRYNGDFLGCAKSNGTTIFNYVPKERRLKKPQTNPIT